MYRLFSLLILFCISFSISYAQDLIDYTSLITKTGVGEFTVDGAAKIDHVRAREFHDDGVTHVDVRREIQFGLAHIAGAVNLEPKSVPTEKRLAEHVSKDQAVVFCCSDAKCYRSANASAMAVAWGCTNVMYFADGWSTWLAKNYERE